MAILGALKKTTEQFAEEARSIHGDAYDYSLVEYVGYKKNVTIICNRCSKSFRQSPSQHLDGKGCHPCKTKIAKLSVAREYGDKFAERARAIHGDKYCYCKSSYVNSDTKLAITCRKCNREFWQTPDSHIGRRARGCPTCRESRGEKAIREFLIENRIAHEVQWKPTGGVYGSSGMEYDFKINNLLIEFDGIQHWWPVERFGGQRALTDCIYRDLQKTKWAHENGYHLLRINYTSLSVVEDILEDALLQKMQDGAGI